MLLQWDLFWRPTFPPVYLYLYTYKGFKEAEKHFSATCLQETYHLILEIWNYQMTTWKNI